jgi:predicted nuclease of restriction endonuclease-like (RecB) superfamily
MKISKEKYNDLLKNIGSAIETGRNNALSALNEHILLTYWDIGRHIVEFEQHGSKRAEYGTALINNLSADLKLRHGKGFSRSNIKLMRLFYINYPKFQTSGKFQKSQTSGKSGKSQTSGKLTWSHYSELIGVSDDMARGFYEQQGTKENWSVRELKRQIDSALFQRLALSKDKKGVLALATKGHHIATTADLTKDPYVFEFLKIPESKRVTEAALEKKLIDNLQSFLLELGKGFSFVARQFRITLDNKHFRIDLVFYHRILKCFILIDLKTRKVKHGDIGQMNLYLNYFKEEENTEGDNEPIGIIIAADKHEYLVKYATGGLSNKIFVSKYQLYLPDKKLLEQKVKEIIEGD